MSFRTLNLLETPSSKETVVQWNLDLRTPNLRKNLNLRNIVGTTDFLVQKLFDLRMILDSIHNLK